MNYQKTVVPISAEEAAQQITERLVTIQDMIHTIDSERQANEQDYYTMQEMKHKFETGEEKVTATKMRNLYKGCVEDANREESLIREALDEIIEIRNIRNERRLQARSAGTKETMRRGALMKSLQNAAQTLPLYVSKPEGRAPPLCGAVPADSSYIARAGDIVAALVKMEAEEDSWILAEIVSYNSSTSKYEVDDIDETKDRHVLSKGRIVPLPLMRANPDTDEDALFPKGTLVMALYPQTTCFYKAVVNSIPQTAGGEYELLFEDGSYNEGYSPPLFVAQRYVIAFKVPRNRGSQSS